MRSRGPAARARGPAQRGFTLIEVVLTIVIIALAGGALVSTLGLSTQRQLHAEVTTTATKLAEERMEQLIAEKRANGFGSAALAITPAPGWIAVPGFAGYERQTEICNAVVGANIVKSAPCNAAGTTGYKYLTVTVRYTALGGTVTSDVVSVITDS